jgi:hypothetical protein
MTGPAMCGGTARHGGPCGKTAGFGTDHVGWGNCKHHGGNSPNGKAHAARLQAKAEGARLGLEVPLDPADALSLAVRLVGGQVSYLRSKLAEAEEADDDASLRALSSTFASALDQLARVGKLAADAGIDERRLQLDALVIERIGAAVQAAIGDAALDEDTRARLDSALRQRLGELTDDDLRPKPKALPA